MQLKKIFAFMASVLTMCASNWYVSAMNGGKKNLIPNPPIIIEVKSDDDQFYRKPCMHFAENPDNLKELTCWYCKYPINLNETCVIFNCGGNFFDPKHKSYFLYQDTVPYSMLDDATKVKLNHLMHSECSKQVNLPLSCPFRCPTNNNHNSKKYKVYFDTKHLVHIRDSRDLGENYFKLSMHLPDEYQNLTCCRCDKEIPVDSPFVFYGCSEGLFNEISIFDEKKEKNKIMLNNLNNFSTIKDHAVCPNCALKVGLPYSTNKEKFACPKCKNESQYVTLIYYPAAKHEDVNLLKGDIMANLNYREEC